MNYYLAGPFFIEECREFFDKIIERCKETSMANYNTVHEESNCYGYRESVLTITNWDEKNNVEPKLLSQDKVFVPGHFKVDFNKIKFEYDVPSFRRVLRQVLDLDLDNLTDGIIIWPKGYDLGTMFELGYFLAGYMCGNPMQMYNIMRHSMIINEPDETLINCIEYFIGNQFFNDVVRKFDSDSDRLLISEGEAIMNTSSFSCIALNVDCYKSTPFNSILAGIFYRYSIPFFTYSTTGADSNVMMIASSMFHVKLDPNKDIEDQLRGEVMNNPQLYYWDDTYFDKFKDIK